MEQSRSYLKIPSVLLSRVKTKRTVDTSKLCHPDWFLVFIPVMFLLVGQYTLTESRTRIYNVLLHTVDAILVDVNSSEIPLS